MPKSTNCPGDAACWCRDKINRGTRQTHPWSHGARSFADSPKGPLRRTVMAGQASSSGKGGRSRAREWPAPRAAQSKLRSWRKRLSAMIPHDRTGAVVSYDGAAGGLGHHHASWIGADGSAMVSHHGARPAPQVSRTSRDPRIARVGGRRAISAQQNEGQHGPDAGSRSLRHFRSPVKRLLDRSTLHRSIVGQCEAGHTRTDRPERRRRGSEEKGIPHRRPTAREASQKKSARKCIRAPS